MFAACGAVPLSCRTGVPPGQPRPIAAAGSLPDRFPARTQCVGGGGKRDPVTSVAVLIGWPAVLRRYVTGLPRRGALPLGCVAVVLMGLVNLVACTTVTDGTATPDTKVAPAYRSSVSVSVSASSATSRVRESQRQHSLTARAVHSSCDSLAESSTNAIDKVNDFVSAFNRGRNTSPTEAPAIDALNSSASRVASSLSDALSSQLRDALNDYINAARAVAKAIGTHSATSEFNKRVDQLNDTKTKALKLCLASF